MTKLEDGFTVDEELIGCVECGHTIADCICNIEDELRQDDGDEDFE